MYLRMLLLTAFNQQFTKYLIPWKLLSVQNFVDVPFYLFWDDYD